MKLYTGTGCVKCKQLKKLMDDAGKFDELMKAAGENNHYVSRRLPELIFWSFTKNMTNCHVGFQRKNPSDGVVST